VIEAGEQAPDFTLPDQDGKPVSPKDFRGGTVVLVFYPNDFSPVCTEQLSVYQEALAEFDARGVQLVGVSVDSAYCHKAFREHLDVTIPLLADFHPKGEVARAYGVWSDAYGVSARALVMIGPDGKVLWSHTGSPLEVPGADVIMDALDERAPRLTK
jgi:peroxiredoxin